MLLCKDNFADRLVTFITSYLTGLLGQKTAPNGAKAISISAYDFWHYLKVIFIHFNSW